MEAEQVRKIARALSDRQLDILHLLASEKRLGLATRIEDRERQGLRRIGLIAYCGSPKRRQISSAGLAVRAYLFENRLKPERP